MAGDGIVVAADGVVVADDGDGADCDVDIGPAADNVAGLAACFVGTSGVQNPFVVAAAAASGRIHKARDRCQ